MGNGNTIESTGAVHLFRALACNRSLVRLEMRNNGVDTYSTVGDDCVSAIEAFKKNCSTNVTFAYLDLRENVIGDEGGKTVLNLYERRKEAGLTTINIKVSERMRSEIYNDIAKGTKWVDGGDGKSASKGK